MSPEARIATFDQDGTLWVEQPMYAPGGVLPGPCSGAGKAKPELANVEPFKTVLSGDREAMAKLRKRILKRSSPPHSTGMTVDVFNAEVEKWIEAAKDPRWKRPYTDLTYQPMQEVMSFFGPMATRPTSLPAVARISCGCIRRARLWHSAGAGGRHRRRYDVRLRRGR